MEKGDRKCPFHLLQPVIFCKKKCFSQLPGRSIHLFLFLGERAKTTNTKQLWLFFSKPLYSFLVTLCQFFISVVNQFSMSVPVFFYFISRQKQRNGIFQNILSKLKQVQKFLSVAIFYYNFLKTQLSFLGLHLERFFEQYFLNFFFF